MAEITKGIIRVGRYNVTNPRNFPEFTPIVVMTKSHGGEWTLSPYHLKDDNGCIMENIWQFSKVYEKIPSMPEKNHRGPVYWQHGVETHYENEMLLPAYWIWREKGFHHNTAVRYPVGFQHRTKCLFCILSLEDQTHLGYITSRKKIYAPVYCDLAKKQVAFQRLQQRLQHGENLLILEVDGPHQESMDYYKQNYHGCGTFIQNDTMLANEENLTIMLNDEKHPFGHGYCLAMSLLGMEHLLNA